MKAKNILLIGVGWFGKNHLKVWRALEKRGSARLVGIVEKDERTRRELREEQSIPVFAAVRAPLLKRVDAVDIVTPTPTHFALVRKCLRYTNVFVEKPLAEEAHQARELGELSVRYKRVLMVGHIFRFHPVTMKLQSFFQKERERPSLVTGQFISPLATWKGKTTALDNLHFFDILDFLFCGEPSDIRSSAQEGVLTFRAQYPQGMKAEFELGWRGKEKERLLDFCLPNKEIHCDFKRNIIVIQNGQKKRTIRCQSTVSPLESELAAFLEAVSGTHIEYTDSAVAARIITVANAADAGAKRE
ncbi:MAG TPA: Gfo/Idh/MocA family oxidoreductase [Candidatus Paceibacterota bacterium]